MLCEPATPGVEYESAPGLPLSRRGRRVAFLMSRNRAAGLPQTKRLVVLKMKWSLGRSGVVDFARLGSTWLG